MKETIKLYFPLALTALCAVFAISILFAKHSSLQEMLSKLTSPDYSSTVANELYQLTSGPLPTLKYTATTLTVGDANHFKELFSRVFSDGNETPFHTYQNAALYLVDVKNSSGTSILTKLSTPEIDALESLPSAAIYDTEKQLLYFHKSGSYTLYIRFYFEDRSGILYECQIPVETR